MAAELFNSLGGFSVGIPAVEVVDGNGNIVSNFNNLSGNVSANKVYSNSYYYANGQPFNADPGGVNTQLQYNNNGNLAGIPNVTWNGNILNLGDVAKLSIAGGINGYYLQTDGAGGLTWGPAGNGGSGNGVPGGANSQVQFNDEDNFGGAAGFTFDKVSGNLHVPNNVVTGNVVANYFVGDGSYISNISIDTANYVSQSNQSNITSVGTLTSLSVAGNVNLGTVSNVHISGGLNGYVLTTDGFGNLTWQAGGGAGGSPGGANAQIQFNDNGYFGGASSLTYNKNNGAVSLAGNITVQGLTANNTSIYGNANVSGNVTATYFNGNGAFLTGISPDTANYVTQPNQSNITSVGTLLGLNVDGNILASQSISAASIQTAGNANVGTLRVTGTTAFQGAVTANGTVNLANSSNVNVGNVSHLHIAGGLNGYFLQTDGFGNLSWAASGGSGGNTNPGGATTQIQYNDNGNFAASPYFTFDSGTNTVQVGGKLIANAMQLGSGAYKFGSSSVYFATTATTNKTRLYTIPVTECSGVNFEIIGTDSAGSKRQSVNISSLYYAGIVQYSEYGGVFINGGVGDFSVEYNPGDVITPPSLDLNVIPDTSNSTVYKIWITILAP